MISKKMQDAINEQINKEMYSSYLYLSMAAQAEDWNLKGFANWLEKQADEESEHAEKLYEHLVDRSGRVLLKAIDGPPTEWKSPLAMFEEVYAHEQKVTAMIHNLVALSRSENDYASEVMLHWFVSEQVEEEANSSEIVERLKRIKDSSNGLMMLDRSLGERE
ncbi:MAG: ferritin [Spirochaetales bacterium]|nr:ferritin [Spirochaetales bacterium]